MSSTQMSIGLQTDQSTSELIMTPLRMLTVPHQTQSLCDTKPNSFTWLPSQMHPKTIHKSVLLSRTHAFDLTFQQIPNEKNNYWKHNVEMISQNGLCDFQIHLTFRFMSCATFGCVRLPLCNYSMPTDIAHWIDCDCMTSRKSWWAMDCL